MPMIAVLRIALRALLVALLIGSAPARAIEVPGLFHGSVPIAADTPDQRDTALHQALAQVLVRVTGERSIGQSAAALPVLDRARQLVVSFGVVTDPSNPQQMTLDAHFDPQAVEEAVREADLPVWGESRPLHLFWIAIQDGPKYRIIGRAGAASEVPGLFSVAQERGLPVLFPTLDTQDQSGLGIDALWGENDSQILAASRRYRAPQVVVCRASHDGPVWELRWALLSPDGGRQTWSSSGPSLDAAISDGAEQLADRQAARLAVLGGAQAGEVNVHVAGITTLDDYSRVLAFLQDRNGVQHVVVTGVEADTVMFRVDADGGVDALDRMIGASELLQRDQGPATQADTLDYRLAQ